MTRVTMHHPTTKARISVPESAVEIHGSSGWEVVEEVPEDGAPATNEAGEAGPQKAAPTARKSPKEGDK